MKNLLRYLAFALMIGGACAQGNLPPCQGSIVFLWSNCFGTHTFLDRGKYVGEFREGMRDGQGVLYASNGSIVNQGLWSRNIFVNSLAAITSTEIKESNLPSCEGGELLKWTNCFGANTYPNGEQYVGEYKDGKRHGQGNLLLVNGSKYIGEFNNDNRNGKATVTFSNGDKYVGEFKNNSRDGQGTYTYASSDKYIGTWKEDKFSGEGTFTYANGSKYIGEFVNGNFNGQGVIVYSNGDRFAGEFKDGKLNGLGTITSSNGDGYVGEFQDGKFNGQGTMTYAQGGKYVGEFNDGKFHGYGSHDFYDGSKYIGQFRYGNRSGRGILYLKGGSISEQGLWSAGVLIRNEDLDVTAFPFIGATPNLSTFNSASDTSLPQLNSSNFNVGNQVQSLRRMALVIGNANYKFGPLRNPRNDADDISRSLRSSGFEVIDLRDATLQQMRNGVRQFGDRLINNDVGLVYYSGHGVEVKGRNYFIPVNADIMREDEIADQGLDVSLILEKMNTAGKGVNILIVDACRNDPFGRSFRSSSRGLAQMDAPRGTIIAYATSPGKVASDGDPRGRNSPYTKNLVKAMQQPNKPIEQVFKEVRRAVQEETKNQQTPWENTSLSGDFYFKVQR